MTDEEKLICDKFRNLGEDMKSRCSECPLSLEWGAGTKCKANSHWSPERKEWVSDFEE